MDNEPRRRLVRDDGRTAVRAARAERHPAAHPASARARRGDRESQPALPSGARAGVRDRHGRRRRAPRARAQRVRDHVGGDPRVRARASRHAERLGVCTGRGADGCRTLDGARIVPADRHRGVPGLPLGAARVSRRDHLAVAAARRTRGDRACRGDHRAHAVHRPRDRPRADGREALARASRARRRLRGWRRDHSRRARSGAQSARDVRLDDERQPVAACCGAVVLLAPGGGRCRPRARAVRRRRRVAAAARSVRDPRAAHDGGAHGRGRLVQRPVRRRPRARPLHLLSRTGIRDRVRSRRSPRGSERRGSSSSPSVCC